MRFSLIIALALSATQAESSEKVKKPKDSNEMKKLMNAIAANPFADHNEIYGSLRKGKGKKPTRYPAGQPV